MKKIQLTLIVTAEDDVNPEDLVLLSHDVIDGFELTRRDADIANEFKLVSVDITNVKELKELNEDQSQDLVGMVVAQIQTDIAEGDIEAIEELLRFCPEENLKAFLPEDESQSYSSRWHNAGSDDD